MAGINRLGTPMNLCDEGLDEKPEEVEKRKRELVAKQTCKSPFLIGSIEDVNQKIGKLERRLQSYTQLVAESRASERQDLQDFIPSSNHSYQQRDREKKDVQRFAGFYAFKSTFFPKVSTRVKKISKISKDPCKEMTVKKEKDAGKPKFVELYQFPGYDPNELTPLPGRVTSTEILEIVVQASVRINKKHKYWPEFHHLFFSQASQAILQDTFWYFFLEKFQKNPAAQQKIFNRVAHNYVGLLFDANNPHFRDTFLKQYPTLISQAVYATFCRCFPDSYQQFGEKFKDDVVFLVFSWIAGIRPPPRCWMEWSFENLEPQNIRTKADMMHRNKKRTHMALSFDYLSSLVSQNSSQMSSLSFKTSASSSTASSQKHVHFGQKHGVTVKRKATFQKDIDKEGRGYSPSELSVQDSLLIDAVALEQKISDNLVATDGLATSGGKGSDDTKDTSKMLAGTAKQSEDMGEELKKSRVLISEVHEKHRIGMVSHPACKGPDFVKASFNLKGQSPLVAHFLQLHNITSGFNLVIHIPHSEVEGLPPKLDAPTYQDVIHQSSKVIKTIEHGFQEMYTRRQLERAELLKEHRTVLREHKRKEAALLSNSFQVKRLTDLIVLEQKKGHDPISAGANQAIEAALMGE